jgi:hypothetical protein
MNHKGSVFGRRLRPTLGRLSRYCLVTTVLAVLFTGHSEFHATAASSAEPEARARITESFTGNLDETVGIMQMNPSTVEDKIIGMTPTDAVHNNVHAGATYLANSLVYRNNLQRDLQILSLEKAPQN